jgi:hypothetical protein
LECYRAADGIMTATAGNGDFGTSPIFGQPSGKPLIASIHLAGVSPAKHKTDREIKLLIPRIGPTHTN